jgi:TolA-binding protein
MKGLYIVLASLMVSACATIPGVKSPAQTDFESALYHARQNVDSGNYWAAERLLDEFTRTHPDTRESREIAFWKAAYQVDPANDRGSLDGGIASLDAYLAADTTGWYKNEAILLRRTAAVAQGVAGNPPPRADTSTTGGTTATDTVVVVRRSRDEEIVALREQLSKARAELSKVSEVLERIKKRLANPSN